MASSKDLQRVSRWRRQLLDLRDEAARLLEVCLGPQPLLKGSVYRLKRKCGRPSCRCARGQLHATMVLSWSQDGRTRLRVIPKNQVTPLQALTQRYRQVRRVRARLVKIHAQVRRLIDRLEAARRQGA